MISKIQITELIKPAKKLLCHNNMNKEKYTASVS